MLPSPCIGTNPHMSMDRATRWSTPPVLSRVNAMLRVTPRIRIGATSVPSGLSCSRQAGGTSLASTVTRIASYGARRGWPCSPSPTNAVTWG